MCPQIENRENVTKESEHLKNVIIAIPLRSRDGVAGVSYSRPRGFQARTRVSSETLPRPFALLACLAERKPWSRSIRNSPGGYIPAGLDVFVRCVRPVDRRRFHPQAATQKLMSSTIPIPTSHRLLLHNGSSTRNSRKSLFQYQTQTCAVSERTSASEAFFDVALYIGRLAMRAGNAGSGRNEGRSPTSDLSSQHRVPSINAQTSESPAEPRRSFRLFDPRAGGGISRPVLWRARILGHNGQFTLVNRCSKPQKTYHFFPFPQTFFSGMKPLSG
jgi:hypothetical protein